MSPTSITVFLLDDHHVVRRGIAQLIDAQADMTVVGESDSARFATERILRIRPQIALLDISLGDGSGLEVCRSVAAQTNATSCLILTSVLDERARIEAQTAGAAGFCLKSLRSIELFDAIRMVAAGAQLLDPAEMRLAHSRLSETGDGLVDSLTSQERVIFNSLGRGLSNRQIGAEMFLAEKTVKNYVSNVLSKLGLSRRTEIAAMSARPVERESHWRPASIV